MKGGLIRKRVVVDAAGAGEVGREADAPLGNVIARRVPFLDIDLDRHRTEARDVLPPELRGRNIERPRPLLRPVFVDVVETYDVLRHDDSACNLKDLHLISRSAPAI